MAAPSATSVLPPHACRATTPEIAALIRRVREEQALTQYDLAARLHSTQSTVARWESGEHDFKTETLTRIANGLGVELVVHFGSDGAAA